MLIVLNALAYICFPVYALFNCIATSIIILIEMVLQCIIFKACLKDGFTYSLATTTPIVAIVCVILGITAKNGFNNINLFMAIILIIIQTSLLLILKKYLVRNFK